MLIYFNAKQHIKAYSPMALRLYGSTTVYKELQL